MQNGRRSRQSRTRLSTGLLVIAAVVGLSCFTESAYAIPAFARKYQTSCTTCHAGFPKLNGVGLAFRMNGYRFAQGDEDLIKDKPLELGNDSYKDMFPNSILPSTIPGSPPIAIEVQQLMTSYFRQPHNAPSPGPSPNFNFPTQVNLMSAGTLSKNISFWVNGGLTSGGTGYSPGVQGFNPYLERAFISFNNLFSADDEEDENGMHLAGKGLVLPKHFLNIRFGQFEPQAIAPYNSTYRALSIANRLTSTLTVGSSSFAFEPALRGIEFYGVSRNYTSWCFGFVDGAGQAVPSDNNSNKDFYGRLGHKWWGYPLDGEVVAPQKTRAKPKVEVSRSQNPDDESSTDQTAAAATVQDDTDPTPWVDYYRQTQFETGIFAYTGLNAVSPLNNPFDFTSGTTGDLNRDRFQRYGVDFQWQHQDLHILGTGIYGRDSDAGTGFSISFYSWFLEANYYFKPWIIGYARYEELRFQQGSISMNNIQRMVPGVALYPIANMAIRTEFNIDTSGNGTSPNQLLIMADYAF